MKKSYSKRVRHHSDGIDIVADVNAVMSINEGRGQLTASSSRQKVKIVSRRDQVAGTGRDGTGGAEEPSIREEGDDG